MLQKCYKKFKKSLSDFCYILSTPAVQSNHVQFIFIHGENSREKNIIPIGHLI